MMDSPSGAGVRPKTVRGELERLPHRPDALVLDGREDLRGVADCHPVDRHRGFGRHGRIHVHDPVDPHFGVGAETRAVEDAGTDGNEDGIFHGAAREMRVGADQDLVGEADRMSGSAAQHGLFHDDAWLGTARVARPYRSHFQLLRSPPEAMLERHGLRNGQGHPRPMIFRKQGRLLQPELSTAIHRHKQTLVQWFGLLCKRFT